MKASYVSEDIGILGIDAMEYGEAYETVETPQSCHIAWGMEDRLETIVHHIPRWLCRMDIVTDETDEVDHQERP